MSKLFGRLQIALIGAFVATAPAFADLDDTEPKSVPPFDPPLAADEMIGTLPTYWSEDEFPIFTANAMDPFSEMFGGLSFECYVHEDSVQDLFQLASGYGFAVIGPGGVDTYRVRVFGNIRLELDEALASTSAVDLSLHLGSNYDQAICFSKFDGELAKVFYASAHGPSLPLALDKPWIKAKYADSLYSLLVTPPQGDPGQVSMVMDGSTVQLRIQS